VFVNLSPTPKLHALGLLVDGRSYPTLQFNGFFILPNLLFLPPKEYFNFDGDVDTKS